MRVTSSTWSGAHGSEVPYTLIQQQGGSDTLCILLPGAGYSVDRPLLYYATMLFLKKKCDVLLLQYDYREHPQFLAMNQSERGAMVSAEVRGVIDEVTAERTHQHYILFGKSIGTRAMAAELTQREKFQQAQAIWLTPLLHEEELYHQMTKCRQSSFYVIGDADPCYVEERFQALAEQPHAQTMLVAGADHNLDLGGDPLASIDVLGRVFRAVESFLG